jgi:hypothetical protein
VWAQNPPGGTERDGVDTVRLKVNPPDDGGGDGGGGDAGDGGDGEGDG